ncbi:MAG: VanZ family protein [Verrucomicrobiales bacterium]|nr:VanZ family protein [Verrucomicrobiales bacterium]
MTKLYELLRHKFVWWALFVLWLMAIFYASSLTDQETRPYIPTFALHKLAHFVAYGSGGVILALSLRFSTRWGWGKIAIVSIAVVSVYGATDEFHQTFTPGRGPAARDWAIDTVSGAAWVGMLVALKGRLKRWIGVVLNSDIR